MVKAVIFDMYETLITLYESPLYFGTHMAIDAGIEEEKFQEIWRTAEADRTIGKITLEEIVEKILKTNDCYSETKMNLLVNKRIRNREEAFEHLHKDIIPMLRALKKKGVQIGLISNCFSEEAMIIKKSVLYPYFDAVCLSFDEGLQKPNPDIFKRCLDKLNVQAEHCLYVGDGGSNELEGAEMVGMKAVQAVWYLKESTIQPSKRKAEFRQLEAPLDILNFI
ncbi:MAG: HAD family hydrolase [Lachnospiraceae bacterium]|nr:HAD family hydrolase [Lachnospiraceae bacterium]